MSVTEEIKARLDIVQLVAEYGVPLKKAGRNFTAPCPFHSERTPSFVVFPDRQSWHCFGACSEGGDIFSFVMKREGLDFPSALRLLAEKAGVTLKARTDEQQRKDERLDRLRGLLQEAARFFHEQLLKSGEAAQARAYVKKRGLSDETISRFQIGYAPETWQAALDHLRQIGYALEDIIEGGVAIHSDAGRVYDRFRNRLMIPIADERGRVIGFGARALNPDDNPKYLNSPQTPLFDKSATLFALHLARRAIREGETAVIVEGYMDAIQAHQAGFTNVVAQMGTALTEAQLKGLGRYARRLILALDPDAAGAKATMRGLNVVRQTSEAGQIFFDPSAMMRQASRLDVALQVVTLPEGYDPDDLIREDPDGWRALIDSARDVAEYVIEVGVAGLSPGASLTEREQVARELLPILMATENDLQRDANVQRLAYKLRLGSGRMLVEWARGIQRAPRVGQPSKEAAQPSAQGQAEAPTQPERLARPNVAAIEGFCLAMLLRYPEYLSAVRRRLRAVAATAQAAQAVLGPLAAEDFTRTDYRVIFEAFERAMAQEDQDWLEHMQAHLPGELLTEIEGLLREPLETFEQQLARPLRADWQSVNRSWHKASLVMARSADEQLRLSLERRVLELRQQRLKRDNMELQFLQQETEPTYEAEIARRVSLNRLALRAIGNMLKEMSQRQRED